MRCDYLTDLRDPQTIIGSRANKQQADSPAAVLKYTSNKMAEKVNGAQSNKRQQQRGKRAIVERMECLSFENPHQGHAHDVLDPPAQRNRQFLMAILAGQRCSFYCWDADLPHFQQSNAQPWHLTVVQIRSSKKTLPLDFKNRATKRTLPQMVSSEFSNCDHTERVMINYWTHCGQKDPGRYDARIPQATTEWQHNFHDMTPR